MVGALHASSRDRARGSSSRDVQRRITTISKSGFIGIRCNRRVDTQVESAFNRILSEVGTIDILVNIVWGTYEGMVEDGNLTWTKPFWDQPLWRWDAMFNVRTTKLVSLSHQA